MTVQIMIDLETGGTKPGCKIFSIGAAQFHINNGVTSKFYVEIQRDSQCGLIESASTMNWWAKQSPESRQVYEGPQEDKQMLLVALTSFSDWLESLEPGVSAKKAVFPWGNSARFDLGILEAAYDVFGMDVPWNGFNERCYRTLKTFYGAYVPAPARQGMHHNALDDAVYQAQYAILMLKKHRELTIGM